MLNVSVAYSDRNHKGKWLLVTDEGNALQMSEKGNFSCCHPADAVSYTSEEVDRMVAEANHSIKGVFNVMANAR